MCSLSAIVHMSTLSLLSREASAISRSGSLVTLYPRAAMRLMSRNFSKYLCLEISAVENIRGHATCADKNYLTKTQVFQRTSGFWIIEGGPAPYPAVLINFGLCVF